MAILPILPSYFISKLSTTQLQRLRDRIPRLRTIITLLPQILTTAYSLNLAFFYINGTYHSLTQRLLRAPYISSIPPNPLTRPPSYALLGVLILARLLQQLIGAIKDARNEVAVAVSRSPSSDKGVTALQGAGPSFYQQDHQMPRVLNDRDMYLDYRPVSAMLRVPVEEEDLDYGMCNFVDEWRCTILTFSHRAICPRYPHFARGCGTSGRNTLISTMHSVSGGTYCTCIDRMRPHILLELYRWMGSRETGMPTLQTKTGAQTSRPDIQPINTAIHILTLLNLVVISQVQSGHSGLAFIEAGDNFDPDSPIRTPENHS